MEQHNEDFKLESFLIKHLLNKEEKIITKEVMNKKILGLAYLQVVEFETEKLLESMLGDRLVQLYGMWSELDIVNYYLDI